MLPITSFAKVGYSQHKTACKACWRVRRSKQKAVNRESQATAARERKNRLAVSDDGSATSSNLMLILDIHEKLCYACGLTWSQWDHVYPILRGGAHSLRNLRPMCSSCNSSKSGKLPWTWRPDLYSDTDFRLGSKGWVQTREALDRYVR